MGCASSKQPKRCRHCQSPYSPVVVTRSYSMHVHHPPQSENDSYHLVALTSTTLGSLKLDSPNGNAFHDYDDHRRRNDVVVVGEEKRNDEVYEKRDDEFSVGLIEAKTWSAMIDQKIPKFPPPRTPIRTPPGEPETINAWELMEGLDDVSPYRSPIHLRSFSFDVVRDPISLVDRPKPREMEDNSPKKPMWLQTDSVSVSNSTNSVITESEFDPEMISSFRNSLEKLDDSDPKKPEKPKLILYSTSLRGVRKTYEDCCHVRVILRGLGFRLDERDVSMHSGFRDELRELSREGRFSATLPRVFAGDRHVGGADEIRRLNEEGQLEKSLECCERARDFDGDLTSLRCEACGDIRFVPCETCSGSCKIYYQEQHREEEQNSNDDHDSADEDFGFQRCPDCNENGLIRCPICCY